MFFLCRFLFGDIDVSNYFFIFWRFNLFLIEFWRIKWVSRYIYLFMFIECNLVFW